MAIIINLDVVMAKNKIGLTELANEVDITLANLSILKKQQSQGRPPFNLKCHLQGIKLPAW